MALKFSIIKGNIEVVAFADSAVNCTEEDYAAYLESFTKGEIRGDEALLKLEGEPARFVLRREIPYEASLQLKQSVEKFGQDRSTAVVMEDVRYALVDIKNPDGEEGLAFKKGRDGLADKDLIGILDRAQLTWQLYAARANSTVLSDALKKKSKPSSNSSTSPTPSP